MSSQELSGKYGPQWRGPRFFSQGCRQRMLLEVTGQLADIVHLGVPLGAGIATMATSAPNHKMRTFLAVLGGDLKNGLPLHEALSRRSNFFPTAYVDIIRVGEQAGRLGPTLDRLEENLLQTGKFHADYSVHLLYLRTIFFATLLIAAGSIVFVLPQFEEIFSSFGSELPLTAQGLLFLRSSQWVFLPAILALALLLMFFQNLFPVLSQRRNRLTGVLWRVMEFTPFIKRLYRARDLALVARQLELLTWANLPLDKALDDVAAGDVGPLMSAALNRVSEAVTQGLPFAEALSREKRTLFPQSFCGLVALGEQAGTLSAILGQLAQIYQGETLNRARMMLNIGAPLGVCCVGAYVFLICHAFYGPITSMSSLVMK